MAVPLILNKESVFPPNAIQTILNKERVFTPPPILALILNKESVLVPGSPPPPPPPSAHPCTGNDADQAVSVNTNTGALHFHTFPFRLGAGWPGESLPTLNWLDLLPFTWANIADTYPTWESMGGTLVPTEFLSDVTGLVYRSFYDLDDDGVAIAMQWEPPPRFLAGPKNVTEFDCIENTFETPPGGAKIAVEVGVTETAAEAAGPTYTLIGTHDTAAPFAQPLTYAGVPPIRGRLMNFRYRCTSSIPVKFKGAVAYVVAEERPS